MKKIYVHNKLISSKKPFVIAEAGVNHNGDINLAKKLIDVASKLGVDAIKFQTYKTESLVTKEAGIAKYQENNLGTKVSQQEMLKKLELSDKDFEELKKYCDSKDVLFLSTPHTTDAVDFLDHLVPAYKIGSGDLNNLPLLREVAKKNKPIILSTGMSFLKEVKLAVKAITDINQQLIILHCTSLYPCPLKDVNLAAMLTLMNEFDYPVGYSDHTLGIEVPLMAVSLGAVMIEKHFTIDRNMPGPDHKASATPEEIKSLIIRIREGDLEEPTAEVLGTDKKKPTDKELDSKKVVRKSIVSKRAMEKGHIITTSDLIIKRPGTGIPPEDLSKVIGTTVVKKIIKDKLIKWEDLEK